MITFELSGGANDMEIHDPGEWHDVRHVREPCEQRGAKSFSGEEGYLVMKQK